MHLVDFIKMVTISKGLAWIKDIKMKSILEDFTCDLVILHMTKNFNSRSLHANPIHRIKVEFFFGLKTGFQNLL